MPTRLRLSAVAAAVVGGATLAAPPASAQTGLDERHQHVATLVSGDIEVLTGPVTGHCGIYTLSGGPDSPTPVSRREVATALRCVRDAQRRGRGAWAIWQVTGVDAVVYDGIAASAVSAVHLVRSQGNGGTVLLVPCLRPRVLDDGTIDCRAPAVPTDVRALRRDLERLARDVERTGGMDWDDVAETPPVTTAVAGVNPSLADAVAGAQAVVQADGEGQWPRCPHHFDHPLVFRDGWWFCDRDRAFIAALGRLSQAIPRVKRR